MTHKWGNHPIQMTTYSANEPNVIPRWWRCVGYGKAR
jgi:hypothetical protein